MARLIIITCARPGFRRAGIAHPARAEYPAGHWSAEQLAMLRAEPMLSVVDVEAPATEFPQGEGGGAIATPGAPSAPSPDMAEGASSPAPAPAIGDASPAPAQPAEGAGDAPSVSTDAPAGGGNNQAAPPAPAAEAGSGGAAAGEPAPAAPAPTRARATKGKG